MGQLTPEIRSLGAEPVAIGVSSIFAQQAFAESLGVDFPLLSDWDGAVTRSYGVQYDEWKGHAGLAKRSVFVINPDSTIGYFWRTDNAHEVPDLNEAVASLR